MVQLVKRNVSKAADSAFTVYDGDEPRPGGYRAVIKQVGIQKSKGDNLMYRVVLELKAKAGSEKAKYDGYPIFTNVVLTDSDANQTREKSFYMAVCGSAEVGPTVDVDPAKFKAGDKQTAKVTKMNGVNPVGRVVSVQLRLSNATEEYPDRRLECDMIFATRGEDSSEDAPAESIEDDEETEGADEEEIILYDEDELTEMGLPALRKILVDEFEMDASEAKLLKTKAKLVAAVLAAQEEMAEEEDEADDEEAEEDEEDAEEDELDEDDEEDEDEEDPEAELRAELAELDRNALKARIKGTNPDFKFLKSQTDAFLIDHIVKTEPPF